MHMKWISPALMGASRLPARRVWPAVIFVLLLGAQTACRQQVAGAVKRPNHDSGAAQTGMARAVKPWQPAVQTGIAAVKARQAANAFYATRPDAERPKHAPGAPGRTEAPALATPIKTGFLAAPDNWRAAQCGTCHTAIYDEWKRSTHAHARTDPQLGVEMAKSENRWMCLSCHTPLAEQMPRLPTGLEGGDVEKPRYVAHDGAIDGLDQEGVTCLACHLNQGVIEGPTGIHTSAHPTRKATRFESEQLCLSCHQAQQRYPGKTFVCVFDTGEEWKAGPFGEAGVTCQHCHMPAVTRPHATGAKARPGRMHYFAGSGIGKETDPSGRVPPEILAPGLVVTAEADRTHLTVHLVNGAAGHHVPTGDPERHYVVTAVQKDAQGHVVQSDTMRIGQRWEWWPAPKKLDDTRIEAGGMRTEQLVRHPEAAHATITTVHHRMTAEAIAYHKQALAGYPTARQTAVLEVPLPPL